MFAVPTKRVRSVIRKDVVKKYIAAVKLLPKFLKQAPLQVEDEPFQCFA